MHDDFWTTFIYRAAVVVSFFGMNLPRYISSVQVSHLIIYRISAQGAIDYPLELSEGKLLTTYGSCQTSKCNSAADYWSLKKETGDCGYEEHPSLFWWIVGGVTATSLSLSAGVIFICHVWPRIAGKWYGQVCHNLTSSLYMLTWD